MISPKKYARLSRKHQVYWLLRGLEDLGEEGRRESYLQDFYQNFLSVTLAEELRLGQALERQWRDWLCSLESVQAASKKRELEALLLQLTRLEPSDWSDDHTARGCEVQSYASHFPYLGLYLDRVRSPFNVGSIFRSAAAFGVEELWLHPHCPSLEHPRAKRSAMGCIELLRAKRCELPQEQKELVKLPWLALETPEIVNFYMGGGEENAGELGAASSIARFVFPADGGLLLVGSEENGLRKELLEYCASAVNRQCGGGLLSILMPGRKQSLNLGVAAAITLQRWSEVLLVGQY